MAQIGRNDPCPCGSGKKYKSCCGKTEAQLTQKRHEGLKARSITSAAKVQAANSPIKNLAKRALKVITDAGNSPKLSSEGLSEHQFSQGPVEKKSLEEMIGMEEKEKKSS